MNKARWVPATAGAALVAATLVLPAAGVAYASGNGNVTGNGNFSVLSGNTINAPVSVPVNLCGISLGIIGFANSGCAGGAASKVSTDPSGGGGNGNVVGNGNVGLGSGNTVTAPISAPVNVCGVSGAVGGFANSGCRGGANSDVSLPSSGNGGDGNVTGIGNVSGASGNTITAPVSAPVNLCSISLALLGFSNSGCEGGAEVNPPSCPDCTPPNGAAVNGAALGGATMNGVPVDGAALGGAAVDDAALGGAPVDGAALGGAPVNGAAVDDAALGGAPVNDAALGGDPPGGDPQGGTSATMLNGGLPITGADLLLLGAAAAGTIGVGAGAVTLARRRRSGPAS